NAVRRFQNRQRLSQDLVVDSIELQAPGRLQIGDVWLGYFTIPGERVELGRPLRLPKDARVALASGAVLLREAGQDERAAHAPHSILLRGNRALAANAALLAIQPMGRAGRPVQIDRVDKSGHHTPIIWLPRFDPRYPITYWFKEALRLEADERLSISP